MKKDIFNTYYDYMQSVIPELIEAEATISRIKGSKEWKRASNYFKVLYQRGLLKENPCRKNGYYIERGTGVVSLSDIEDILTPDQLDQIRKKAY